MDFRSSDHRSGSPDLEDLYQSIIDQVQQRLQQHYKHCEDEPQVLKRNAEALQNTADNLKTRLYVEAAKKFRQSNARVLLHRLPTEILVAILTGALSVYEDPPEHYRRLHALCQVSYAWWRLILETPCFWGMLSNDLPNGLLDIVLKRSLSYPLTIRTLPSGNATSGFLQKILQQAHRWESLSLFVTASFKVEEYLGRPAPRLRSLSLTLSSGALQPVAKGFKLFGGCGTGQLRDVSLHYGVVKGTWEHLSGARLEKLVLDRLPPHAVSYSQLSGIIKLSPQLHTLALHTINLFPSDTDVRSANPTVMDLPLLRRLNITDSPLETIKAVLYEINAPNCISVRIRELGEARDASNDSLFLDERTSYLRTSITGILQRSRILKATFSYREFQIFAIPAGENAHPTDDTLLLATIPSHAARVFSWLAEGSEVSGVPCPVDMDLLADQLHGQSPSSTKSIFITCFTLLPRLRTLNMNLAQEMDWVFDFLGQKTTSSGIISWPLPNLLNLQVNMENSSWDQLLEMLENRYLEDDEEDAGSYDEENQSDAGDAEPMVASHTTTEEVSRPVMLASLTIKGETYVNEEVLEDIYDLIGRENVIDDTDEPPNSMEDDIYDPYEYGYEEDDFDGMYDIW